MNILEQVYQKVLKWFGHAEKMSYGNMVKNMHWVEAEGEFTT